MRLVFAGTPEPAVPSLRRLAASDHDIVAVVTRRDAPLGRKRVLTPSPVAAAATELGHRRRSAPTGSTPTPPTRIAALEPDLGVIVAYGGLVREPLLSTPAHGWINLHFSLLPRWRGAAPVQHALIAGDERDRRERLPARPRARRRRRVRRARRTVPRATRPPATLLARSPTRARSCSPTSSTAIAAGTARRRAAAGRADLRARSSATTTGASAGTSRATRCSAGSAASPPSPARTRPSTARG